MKQVDPKLEGFETSKTWCKWTPQAHRPTWAPDVAAVPVPTRPEPVANQTSNFTRTPCNVRYFRLAQNFDDRTGRIVSAPHIFRYELPAQRGEVRRSERASDIERDRVKLVSRS